jgi:hypothetical protein
MNVLCRLQLGDFYMNLDASLHPAKHLNGTVHATIVNHDVNTHRLGLAKYNSCARSSIADTLARPALKHHRWPHSLRSSRHKAHAGSEAPPT